MGSTMRLIEIRELEGPNPYLPGPAIKVEMDLEDDRPDGQWVERWNELLDEPVSLTNLSRTDAADRDTVGEGLSAAIRFAASRAGIDESQVAVVLGDIATRFVVAFSWDRRPVALALAALAVEITAQVFGTGALDRGRVAALAEALQAATHSPVTDDDRPEVILIGDGPPRLVAITGTNGKTTTTRLVAHLLGRSGRDVGWSSTSGIYVRGEEIESGDWSGPAGARRLIGRTDLDWAILETARGGILRRGLAYDRAHVSAMINVSADHLGDYGVWSTSTLATVKGTVLRATHQDGWAIINADDPLVFAQRHDVPARCCFFTQLPLTDGLREHVYTGGPVISVEDRHVTVLAGAGVETIAPLEDIPLTFGGAARHMVENVLCATGIALSCGLTAREIGSGLATFVSDLSSNPGRLNVYQVRGATFLADYAHNEAGLAELIHLSRTLLRGEGRLWLIVGTAGDRNDETFRALGRMAARTTAHVVPRDTPNYLRGRRPGETTALMDEGVRSTGGEPVALMPDEISAIDLTVAGIRPGDVVAIMASDAPSAVAEHLAQLASAQG